MGILLLTKSAFAIMIGFLLSIIIGLFLVPFLRKRKLSQNISCYVGENHRKKEGTPTMGGLIFVFSAIIATVLLIISKKLVLTNNLLIVLFVFMSYAFIGFLDDFLSLKRKKNEGLTTLQKLFLQLIISLVFFYLYMINGGETVIHIAKIGIYADLGWIYGLFILFVLIGASNAVNLTDGLDGLSGGLCTISFIAFSLISMVAGDTETGLFIFVLVGSLLGFLIYNTHPAKIFMGDTGSLSLGAVMAAIAILSHREGTLLVVAGVFVIETLSVILQVIWMFLFKKKLFLMTPLHHHFEKLGWQEQDIVKLFWVVGLILAMAGIYYGVWL